MWIEIAKCNVKLKNNFMENTAFQLPITDEMEPFNQEYSSDIIEALPKEDDDQCLLHSPIDKTKEFHLFLSHSSQDEGDVVPILDILEKEPYNLTCCIDRRDFTLGEPTISNINYALGNSMATVLFLTPNFNQSNYCKQELLTAVTLFMERETKIIPVILKSCEIPDPLRNIHYIEDVCPENIAQNIYKTLKTDPIGFKPLPLQRQTAGDDRTNGNIMQLKGDYAHFNDDNIIELTEDGERHLAKMGIQVSPQFKELITISQTFPKRVLAKRGLFTHSGTCCTFIISSFIWFMVAVNSGFLIFCLTAIFPVNPDIYSRVMFRVHYLGGSTKTYLEGDYTITTQGLWTVWLPLTWILFIFTACGFGMLVGICCDYQFDRKQTRLAMRLWKLSVPDAKCCIVPATTPHLQARILKYDISECKAFLGNIWNITEESPIHIEAEDFQVVWKEIVDGKVFENYFWLLMFTASLPAVTDDEHVRHPVLQNKACFCQYFEANSDMQNFRNKKEKQTSRRFRRGNNRSYELLLQEV